MSKPKDMPSQLRGTMVNRYYRRYQQNPCQKTYDALMNCINKFYYLENITVSDVKEES